ncbi:unnamed protein product [Gadus morhua 'NCC']
MERSSLIQNPMGRKFRIAAKTGQPRWLPLSALAATGRAGCHWPRWLPLAALAATCRPRWLPLALAG